MKKKKKKPKHLIETPAMRDLRIKQEMMMRRISKTWDGKVLPQIDRKKWKNKQGEE
jgi:hypothetical protein